MSLRNSANGKNASSEMANKSALSVTVSDKENTEKKKLQEEIRQLRCIIAQAEWSTEVLQFKEVERTIKPQDMEISHTGRIPNIKAQLQNDLYKFAGFHCVKFRRSEVIFNFMSTNEQQKDNTYAVQIFIKDGKCSLGKWVMPMSIDMNQILIKIPIDKLRNLTAFIKCCKHNINCYAIRHEQFLSLKEHTLQMKYCALHSNIGYTQINLELFGVYDSKNDKYINLIIYLLYHSEEARPYKINVDTTTKNKLSNETRQRLKIHLKEFKITDLKTAFDKVFMTENSAFLWTRADDSESPLDMNDTSTSEEEGFLEQLQSEQSLRKAKRKKHELQNKWKKRRKHRSIMKNIVSSEDDSKAQSKEVSLTKNPDQTALKEKETEKVTSSLKQQEQIDKKLLEATPMNRSKGKLKQIKLNFRTTRLTTKNVSKSHLLRSKTRTKLSNKNKKTTQLVTSTPLHPRGMISTWEIDNITEIGSPPKKWQH